MSQQTARSVAFDALRRIEDEGAYANLLIGSMLDRSDLSDQDRRFVTDLVYGTTRRRRACDALVDRFITVPPDDTTRTLLRLGAYQLHFAGVAAHAAVSETVGLASRRTRGFVNAVLRRVAKTEMVWPSPNVELSYPDWIIDRLTAEIGAVETMAALARMNEPPPVTVRDDDYIQDLASQWVAAAVAAQPGELVADVCAAPGGKATAIAASGANAFASDLTMNRLSLLLGNNKRLASNLTIVAADATRLPYADGSFDCALIDAPCSGLGALRRRADARWRITETDIDVLADLQRRIIDEAARVVAVGGRLIYSVCTLTAAESIGHPAPDGFVVDHAEPAVGQWRRYEHGWRVLPHDADTDGMVLIRYRRER